jgi:hypothetical protein
MNRVPGASLLLVLSEAEFRRDSDDFPIQTFSDLMKMSDMGDPLSALAFARSSGGLIEGRKQLGPSTIHYLAETDSIAELRRYRFDGGDERRPGRTVDLLSNLSDSDVEETEMVGAGRSWHVRFRSDEPLIFLAASPVICERVLSMNSDRARLVDSDFVYAL